MRITPVNPPLVKKETIDVEPALLWVKLRGNLRRFLLASVDEEPEVGHPAFDYMVFHGFGGGDIGSRVPIDFRTLLVSSKKIDVENREAALTYISLRMNGIRDGFYAVFTYDGNEFYEITLDPNGVDFYELRDLDWYQYTILGSPRTVAKAHVDSLNRRHIWYSTFEEQKELLETYATLIETL